MDGLNACNKQHLKRYIQRINQPHEGDKYINIKPYLIYKKYSCLLMNVEYIVWKNKNLDQKVVPKKKGGICNNQAKILSCYRCWWKTVYHYLTYQLNSLSLTKKQYDASGDLWKQPYPLWSITWSWLLSCNNNSMFLWVLHIDNTNRMGRRKITSITSSI